MVCMMQSILKRLSMPFGLACIIGIIMEVALIIYTVFDHVLELPIMAWVYSSDFFALVYPIFCSVPFCWIIYYEKKDGYFNYVHTRIEIEKYLQTHYLCGSLMAFICVFVISFLGALISTCFVKPIYPSLDWENDINEILRSFMGKMIINQPLLYGLLLSLWRGFIGMLIYTFSFLISLISRHLLVILTGGFIYAILENFVTAMMGCSNISLCYAFDPSSLNWDCFSLSPYISMLIGPLVLSLFCIILFKNYVKQRGIENGTYSVKVSHYSK